MTTIVSAPPATRAPAPGPSPPCAEAAAGGASVVVLTIGAALEWGPATANGYDPWTG